MRCKCGDNILHVGSKLLMCTARKASVSAEERSQWRPRWSKGLGRVASSPLETDDSLTRSGAAARVPHLMFTSLQVRRCSYWTFMKDNRTTCQANKSQGGDVEIFQLACRVPALLFFPSSSFFFMGDKNTRSLFETIIFSGGCVCDDSARLLLSPLQGLIGQQYGLIAAVRTRPRPPLCLR